MATYVFAVWVCLFVISAAKEDKILRECGGQHVCTTLMRYKDGTTVDEGQYCECKEGGTFCSKEWDGNDESRLTWQHYERDNKNETMLLYIHNGESRHGTLEVEGEVSV